MKFRFFAISYFLALAGVVALSSCATAPRVEIQTVEVPVERR